MVGTKKEAVMSSIESGSLIGWAAIVATVACGCGGSTAASTTDAGGNGGGDSSTTRDAGSGGVIDSGTPSNDSAPPPTDSGTHHEAGPACTPSTATFTPRTTGTPAPGQGVCTASDIAAFVTACGDNGTLSTCSAWIAANSATDAGAGNACGNCILAPNNAGGAFVDPQGYVNPNYGACVELLDKTNGAACATAFDNQADCEAVACDSCTQGYGGCVRAADNGSCSSYVAAANTQCAADNADGGALNTCAPDPQGQDGDYTFIVSLICGGGATDAGAPD
jgi:hypothetical protein